MNPMVGCGMQQAREVQGGASRRGGEEPRGRNVPRAGCPRPKQAQPCGRTRPGGCRRRGDLWKNPVEGSSGLRPGRQTRDASPNAKATRPRRTSSGFPAAWRKSKGHRLHGTHRVRRLASGKTNDPNLSSSGGGSSSRKRGPAPDRSVWTCSEARLETGSSCRAAILREGSSTDRKSVV